MCKNRGSPLMKNGLEEMDTLPHTKGIHFTHRQPCITIYNQTEQIKLETCQMGELYPEIYLCP